MSNDNVITEQIRATPGLASSTLAAIIRYA
jgi:hypothetical protein